MKAGFVRYTDRGFNALVIAQRGLDYFLVSI
jgi:hypothetical protein